MQSENMTGARQTRIIVYDVNNILCERGSLTPLSAQLFQKEMQC